MSFGLGYWHWFFLAQPAPLPERLIGADPDFFLRRRYPEGKLPAFFSPEAFADYERCFTPDTIHAICEDYRATFGVDLEMDNKDFEAKRKITVPVLLLWGATGGVGRNQKSMEIWPRYAADIRAGKALPCGHYLSEEAPDETYRELREFFVADSGKTA